jgi:hypothetical protein
LLCQDRRRPSPLGDVAVQPAGDDAHPSRNHLRPRHRRRCRPSNRPRHRPPLQPEPEPSDGGGARRCRRWRRRRSSSRQGQPHRPQRQENRAVDGASAVPSSLARLQGTRTHRRRRRRRRRVSCVATLRLASAVFGRLSRRGGWRSNDRRCRRGQWRRMGRRGRGVLEQRWRRGFMFERGRFRCQVLFLRRKPTSFSPELQPPRGERSGPQRAPSRRCPANPLDSKAASMLSESAVALVGEGEPVWWSVSVAE